MKRTTTAAIGIALLFAVPLVINSTFYVSVGSQILIFGIFALGLNILAGYGGLVSLGHAGLFGSAAYAGAFMLTAGHGELLASIVAILVAVVTAAIYGLVSLRTSGVGFIMITLALGQILWGLAYRWLSLTNGETGISISAKLAPFGISLNSEAGFYYFVLIVFLIALGGAAAFAGSNLGATLVGARDQPRRMAALGYDVWLIRFLAYLLSGLLSGIAGTLFLFYNQFVSPQSLALSASAEVLLMVISGGAGTLFGPLAGAALVVIVKNVASAYIARWNLMLGIIFVIIVVFMPEGFVPGAVRLWRSQISSRLSSLSVIRNSKQSRQL